MNEIVITGSTGVIGRRAVRALLAAGHPVTGVTRSSRGRALLESLGVRAVEADVYDEASLRRAFDGADAVVNLLTHIPSIDRMADPSAWNENDRLRTKRRPRSRAPPAPPARNDSYRSRSRSCTPMAATGGSTRMRRSSAAASRRPH